MDWLESYILKIKNKFIAMTLIKQLLLYLLIGAIIMVTATAFTQNICLSWIHVLNHKDQESIIEVPYQYYFNWIEVHSYLLDQLNISMKLAIGIYNYCFYLYLIIGTIACINIFYKRKITPAISAIIDSMNFIQTGDLNHEISYQSKDEMGILCRKFDQMRKHLIQEKSRQWSMQEEQRKVNAVFAHDIRTPLTVIKGYTEFIQKYYPMGKVSEQSLMDKLQAMLEQENRILEFSKTMKMLQNMEQREVVCKRVMSQDILDKISKVVRGLKENWGKNIIISNKSSNQEILVDCALVQEVCDNLLNNALRYCKTNIILEFHLLEQELVIFVKDDGIGFSEMALRKAWNTYFSEEENSTEHFGIGLSISRMLCEKHGGKLILLNSIEGGAIVSASFFVRSYL